MVVCLYLFFPFLARFSLVICAVFYTTFKAHIQRKNLNSFSQLKLFINSYNDILAKSGKILCASTTNAYDKSQEDHCEGFQNVPQNGRKYYLKIANSFK